MPVEYKLPIIYSALLEIPAHNKNLPYCTMGYETWTMHHASRITGATFFEIAVSPCERNRDRSSFPPQNPEETTTALVRAWSSIELER